MCPSREQQLVHCDTSARLAGDVSPQGIFGVDRPAFRAPSISMSTMSMHMNEPFSKVGFRVFAPPLRGSGLPCHRLGTKASSVGRPSASIRNAM